MTVTIHTGDALEVPARLPAESVHCCVTSPPYFGLRDYGVEGQLGLEKTPEEYVAKMVEVFRCVRRVLRNDGTLWLNFGDSYANDGKWGGSSGGKHAKNLHGDTGIGRQKTVTGLKPKDLIGIPWRVAFALQADGWYLRSDIIWHKPNPMPESATDRPTKAHEYLFLLAKSPRYYFDAEAVREPGAESTASRDKYARAHPKGGHTSAVPITGGDRDDGAVRQSNGRNIRTVWTVPTHSFPGAHFATFPPKLIEPCIKAGCPAGGMVLDPFGGAGTTGLVADRLGRSAVLIDLNPEYAEMARARIRGDAPLFAEVT